ncbi:MAG TPA: tRNA (5-methylaminomethyl-2-thiouridine)(34)-methyltransferase MnmD [Mucilaginibacter sp.]
MNFPQLTIVPTADGSNTIFNERVGENYHSKHGALQESRHVFLNSGLVHFLTTQGSAVSEVSILEVGFGTGLNFLLSADYCIANHISLNYNGIEAYPLSLEMIARTDYKNYVSKAVWDEFISSYPDALAGQADLNTSGRLQIANCELLSFQSEHQYDIIYFDAFAAAYQPEMWDETAIGHAIKFLKSGGVFVTYAITGNLKRMLKAMGCKIEKAPGAPGKREMLRATKL